MPVIYLIRHGQASFYSSDYDQLSELGYRQAQSLGQELQSQGITPDIIEMGALKRHHQTMKACLSVYHREFTHQERYGWDEYDHKDLLLAARPDLQSFDELAQEIISQKDPKSYLTKVLQTSLEAWVSEKYSYEVTWNAFKTRITDQLHQLASHLDQSQTAFVFTSGGPITVVLMHCLQLPDRAFIQLQHTIVNCAITKLIVSKGNIRLSSFNEHGYLLREEGLLTYR